MFLKFVEGPMWYFAAAVFVVGVVWRLFSIVRLGVKADLAAPRAGGIGGAIGANFSRFLSRPEVARPTGVVLVAGYMFHVGLFVLVFFAAPHVDFIRDRILGFGWTPLPYWAFIVAADIAFIGILILWLRRLLDPVLKKISDFDDHASVILTFVVMFTGCMALLEGDDFLRALHMLTVNLLLIYFPFSRLMHAFTFVFSRSYTGANMGRKGISA